MDILAVFLSYRIRRSLVKVVQATKRNVCIVLGLSALARRGGRELRVAALESSQALPFLGAARCPSARH